eukprot:5302909-Alexandrium_andersonii.AAC.1
MRRRCRRLVAVGGVPRGYAKAGAQAGTPGGSWEPVASQPAQGTASMRAVCCAHIERARACAAEPPRATDSRMEWIAHAA